MTNPILGVGDGVAYVGEGMEGLFALIFGIAALAVVVVVLMLTARRRPPSLLDDDDDRRR